MDLAPGPRDLPALRGAELASAADVLGPTRATTQDCLDRALGEVSQMRLVAKVVPAADSCFPDLLLVLGAAALSGHLDHVTATTAALLASETLNLPVLCWALSKPVLGVQTVAAQLNQELGSGIIGHRDEDTDLRVSLQRAQQLGAPGGAG